MIRIKRSNSRYNSILFGVVALAVMLAAVACDDFYTDSPPTPDIAQPTPANVQIGDPETLMETAAREAMASTLAIGAADPAKILFEQETWTERNPGCYPAPDSITGAYLIPGYRLLMLHDDVYYEYNADEGISTGALCESTFQIVPVEPAHTTVTIADPAAPDTDVIHVIRSEDEVAEFNLANSDIATVGVDEIEFPLEVLVGGWVDLSPDPEPTRAYKSSDGTSIIIEVAIPEPIDDDEDVEIVVTDDPSQIWVLVDASESISEYEFLVVE